LAGALSTVFLFISCSSFTGTLMAPPDIPGAEFVGNKVCSECHSNYTRVFAASVHARVRFSTGSTSLKSGSGDEFGCEACHGPGSKHVAAGGGRGKFIINPKKDPATCFQCHLDTQAEFGLPQHHPVVEGRMGCVQCHDPHGMDILKPKGGLAMARLNQSCAECHREQTRPFVFEHEAMREGCTVCHNPHGSINRKLLVEADPNLCLKCHAQNQSRAAVTPGQIYIGNVDHTAFLRQGTCWSAGCHTAVHGSNMHPRMMY
jgi:predicted CXXCH cytochrome family protein